MPNSLDLFQSNIFIVFLALFWREKHLFRVVGKILRKGKII